MKTGTKLGAYGLVLAAAFGGGAAVGTAAGPIGVGGSPSHDSPTEPTNDPHESPNDTGDDIPDDGSNDHSDDH